MISKSLRYLPWGFAKKAQSTLFYEGYDNITLPMIYMAREFRESSNKKIILNVLLAMAVNNYQKKYR